MKISKDEDRIIERILRGELKIDNSKVQNLEHANLSREQEQTYLKLADEIKQVVKYNEEKRIDVEQKIEKAEKNPSTKLDLIVIEEELRELRANLDKTRYKSAKTLLAGSIITFLMFVSAMFVAFFTNSLMWTLLTMFGGINLTIIPTSLLINKFKKDEEKIKEQILNLEQERFEILGYDNKNMFVSTAEKTKNITRNIYNSKDLTMTDEEIISIS